MEDKVPNNWKRNTHTLISNFSECKRQCTYSIHQKTVKYGGNFCLPFDCGQTKYCYLVTVAIWSAFHSEFAPKTYTILDWKNSFSMDIVLPISSSIKYDTYCRREATGPRSCSFFVILREWIELLFEISVLYSNVHLSNYWTNYGFQILLFVVKF